MGERKHWERREKRSGGSKAMCPERKWRSGGGGRGGGERKRNEEREGKEEKRRKKKRKEGRQRQRKSEARTVLCTSNPFMFFTASFPNLPWQQFREQLPQKAKLVEEEVH